MAIVVSKLESIGTDLETARLVFSPKSFLIRGPSETGKSYIRDCLWYLFGGDKPPKPIPLAEGYQELRLAFSGGGIEYEIRRALVGGGVAVFHRELGKDNGAAFELLERDVGELLVELSGARGKQILRSTSERGPVTGDDLRHWSLLSQTAILSEEPSSGAGFAASKRVASFNLFLSGTDDAAVQLRKSSAEVERIKGQLSSAESAFKRAQAGLPPEAERIDVLDALDRVDEALVAMASHYEARASKLRQLRGDIAEATDRLAKISAEESHSSTMVGRFELLEKKYSNDLERLGATSEGVAFFQQLDEVDCPLCSTSPASQENTERLLPNAAGNYRKALYAEAEKIRKLRSGLLTSLERERRRASGLLQDKSILVTELRVLQNREAEVLNGTRIEFAADPKTLAVRRSELSAQLALFDEIERLLAEIERLKKLKVRPRVQVNRDGGTSGREVADLSRAYLNAWGFDDIKNISLNAEQCDLVINDRPRLSYGAGRRALYLAALVIAIMEHALEKGYPHLGLVVIDSPLKAYADPNSEEVREVSLTTVTDKFYDWLANRVGRGQVIILENEKIRSETAATLHPEEFTGIEGVGRPGFYPIRELRLKEESDGDDGVNDE